MLTIILLLILAYAYYTGYQRGFALQLVYSIGYIICYFIAKRNYEKLGAALELWIPFPSATQETKMFFFDEKTMLELDKAFYAGFAFLVIYFLGYLAVRLIALFAHKLIMLEVFGKKNRVLGGVAGVFAVYIGLFLILSLASMVPNNTLQRILGGDILARAMIVYTPIFSNDVHSMWITDIIGKI
ncbi:Uncharacterized membrane protein, required for colicin V production [Pilibacter termitis]|uniref:Uncharacterized membrane protein, required for colicin V production n=1 Tax=Pilibacter termitis TaxID=263852 RepID=A0A1T4KGJ5_9ENTE|nr:CvpA family protein [Pilibacter termitis]SJZ41540.1 Uncharacterized membrane protein, required for colicin V production [Pilibacter termitis]